MLKHLNQVKIKPSRVVVLGASGFISKHLQNWCINNGIDNLAISSTDIDLTVTYNADRLASLLLPGDSVVMASMVTPEKGQDYLTTMANLRMTETVCTALNLKQCAHFVYLSSDAVYDAQKIPLDEDSAREPTDLYALSHIAREMMLEKEFFKLKIPFCFLRLTAVYGPGDTHNAYGPNRFVRMALSEGRIILYGNGEERRSFIFINDLIKIMGLVLSHSSIGTINIAIQPAISFKEIAQQIANLLSQSVIFKYETRTVPIIHRPYKPTQIFRFLYNMGRPIGQIVHRTFVNSALFEAFPNFTFTPLRQGLSSFIDMEKNINSSNSSNLIDSES